MLSLIETEITQMLYYAHSFCSRNSYRLTGGLRFVPIADLFLVELFLLSWDGWNFLLLLYVCYSMNLYALFTQLQ